MGSMSLRCRSDKQPNWTAAELPPLSGRRIVITGAGSGIGLAAAKAFAARGATVVLAVRDTVKGERVAREIAGHTEVSRLDLADLASIRAFAQRQAPLDVLINNAGVMNTPLQRTADGFELQFGTNHLGHFALTNLLLPRITERVVVIASGAHRSAEIDFEDLNSERAYHRRRVYGQTKLANLLFASELNRRLGTARSPIKVISAHPGLTATNLQKPTGNRLEDGLIAVVVRLFAQSADMGALPTLYAATQDLPGDSYVGPDGLWGMRGHPVLVGRSKAAKDPATARELWNRSERCTRSQLPRRGARNGLGAVIAGETRTPALASDERSIAPPRGVRDSRRSHGEATLARLHSAQGLPVSTAVSAGNSAAACRALAGERAGRSGAQRDRSHVPPSALGALVLARFGGAGVSIRRSRARSSGSRSSTPRSSTPSVTPSPPSTATGA